MKSYGGQGRIAAIICLYILHGCTLLPAAVADSAASPSTTSTGATQTNSAPQLPSGKPERSIIDNMQTIMLLLRNHTKITFTVKLIPGGVQTTNTSTDPDVVKAIQQHAADMKIRNEEGINVRPADPLFQELIRHHAEMTVRLKYIPNGVIEYETSPNPQVTLLIRAHTKTVAEFVKYGLPRAQQPSPIPPGYHGG